jgi:hypothetical protein
MAVIREATGWRLRQARQAHAAHVQRDHLRPIKPAMNPKICRYTATYTESPTRPTSRPDRSRKSEPGSQDA